MRVLVDVTPGDEGWSVTVTLPDGMVLPARPMARLDERPFVGPLGAPNLDPALLDRIERGDVIDSDLEQYGRYLFDSLIGTHAWTQIRADHEGREALEIALRWASPEVLLHAPLWEAMHDGARFISVNGTCPVAVVRMIADAPARPTVIKTAPRVLYVIGSDLSDVRIRPGAEFVGVLRATQKAGSTITPFVLQQASLATIGRAVRRFRPDVVHFVCHGQIVQRQPRLLLRSDEPRPDGQVEMEASPAQVFEALAEPGARLPEIVVLSACETGAGGSQRARSTSATPFAASLVAMGIPVVIAMSGRVADTACRLFSRRFAEALTGGDQLVSAAAHGRRAAYLGISQGAQAPAVTLDCLLPTVFLADGVPPQHAPVDARAGELLTRRRGAYGLDWQPVFCGREDFFDSYERLVDPGDPLSTLFAHWQEPTGVGKDRLLRELAARALADGHIPVMVMPSAPPRQPSHVGAEFGIAIEYARERFDLPSAPSVLLEYMADVRRVPQPPPTSRLAIRSALATLTRMVDSERPGEPPIEGLAIAGAIAADIERLIDDARMAQVLSGDAGAFVVLGDVDGWDAGRAMLLDHLLGQSGLRIQNRKVPCVATWKNGGAAGESLRAEIETSRGRAWERFQTLAPLSGPEEYLAYQWVLMAPRVGDPRPHAETLWVVTKPDGEWRSDYHVYIGGRPRMFESNDFVHLARIACGSGEFAAADDEALLQRYAEASHHG